MKKYLKSLVGFPIGILILALTYVVIYYIDGEATYIREIGNLLEFKFMLAQVILSGIVYMVVFFTLQFNISLLNNKNLNLKVLLKFIVSIALIFTVGKIASCIVNRKGTLAGYTGDVFVGISGLILILTSVIYMIYSIIRDKKINKALKEKQNKE